MLAILSAIVAVACVLASARSLALAIAPTGLDPGVLADCLRRGGDAPCRSLRRSIAARSDFPWESELFSALEARNASSRDALMNELVLEFDWRVRRGARVPRVCASIATSAAFFFACLALLQGLAGAATMGGDADATTATAATMRSALDALAAGIAGTSFCVAIHLRMRGVVRERRAAAERLLGALSGLVSGES